MTDTSFSSGRAAIAVIVSRNCFANGATLSASAASIDSANDWRKATSETRRSPDFTASDNDNSGGGVSGPAGPSLRRHRSNVDTDTPNLAAAALRPTSPANATARRCSATE